MKTSNKQTLPLGATASACLPGAFPASPSASPDEGKERVMTATSGRILSGSCRKCGLLGSSVKMLLESLRWYNPARSFRWEVKPLCSERISTKRKFGNPLSSRPCVVTSKRKDIPSSRLLFRLVPSARPTAVTAYSLLPTVTATDSGTGRVNQSRSRGAKPRPTLARLSKMELLPTPCASEGTKWTTKYSRSSHMGQGLTAMSVNGLLPTPVASDGKRANFMGGKTIRAHGQKKTGESLAQQIARKSSGTGSLMLNPLFVEEMMGFPSMWTALPFLMPDGAAKASGLTGTR